MLHCFIIKAQQVLCDSKPSNAKQEFLQLFSAHASNLIQPIQDIIYASKTLLTHQQTYLYIYFQL